MDRSIRRIKVRGGVTDVVTRLKITNSLTPGHELAQGCQGSSSSFVFPRRSIGPDLFPTGDASLNASNAIESGSNIETEHGAAVGKRRSRIIVDNVSDIFTRL